MKFKYLLKYLPVVGFQNPLHSGTSFNARAEAFITKSFTDTVTFASFLNLFLKFNNSVISHSIDEYICGTVNFDSVKRFAITFLMLLFGTSVYVPPISICGVETFEDVTWDATGCDTTGVAGTWVWICVTGFEITLPELIAFITSAFVIIRPPLEVPVIVDGSIDLESIICLAAGESVAFGCGLPF